MRLRCRRESVRFGLLIAVVAATARTGLAQPAEQSADPPSAAQAAGPQQAEQADEEEAPPRTRAEILRRQREAKRGALSPYRVSRAEERVRFLETWRLPRRLFTKGFGGFRPVLGGMPSGSGLVAGGGYVAGATSERATATANARYSTKGYWAYDAGLVLFPEARSTLPVEGRLTARTSDFGSLRFFGLGGGSQDADRTVYRLEERAVEAGVSLRPVSAVRLGADVQWLTAEAGPGAGDVSPRFRFGARDTPGFGARTDYFVYGGEARLLLYDRETNPAVGVGLTVAGRRFDDRSADRHDFTQVVGELQAQVPLGYRNRILALRARTSHMVGRDGGVPPFYLMETLGGANTIRGFAEYRFRDARNLLFNVEYRWEVWTYLDFVLFYDTGKVFADASGMDLRDLRSGYGFGIRGHAPGGAVLRFDLARSAEGFVLHIGSGPSF